jgi:uncharacterized protein YifE (UPF0438 family)
MEMSENTPFYSDLKFYGDMYFPYGIARAGEFTVNQVALLEKHGHAYQALHLGMRQPCCEEEKQFLAVCQGEREPETEHERVWMSLQQKANSRRGVSAFEMIYTDSPDADHFDDECIGLE